MSVPLFARWCCVLEIEREEGEKRGKRKSVKRDRRGPGFKTLLSCLVRSDQKGKVCHG